MKYFLITLLLLIGFSFCQELEKTTAKDTLKDTLKIIPKTKDTVYIAKSETIKKGTYAEGLIKGQLYGTKYAKENNYATTSCLLTTFLGIIGAGACYLHADQDISVRCPFPEKYTFEYQLGYKEGFNNAYKSIKKRQATRGIMQGATVILLIAASLTVITLGTQ
jgi:hypothetical protein